MASPSGSRTVWQATTSTGTSRSRDHAPDDRELLGVLAAEVGPVGLEDVEQLRHHGRDAAEVAGPALALEGRRPPRRRPPQVSKPAGYISAGAGREQEVAAGLGQEPAVALEVARVAGEVLLGSELGGVHEELAATCGTRAARAAHERQVAGVQVRPWWARGRPRRTRPRARRAPRRWSWRPSRPGSARGRRASSAQHRPRAASRFVHGDRDAQPAALLDHGAVQGVDLGAGAAVDVLQHRGAVRGRASRPPPGRRSAGSAPRSMPAGRGHRAHLARGRDEGVARLGGAPGARRSGTPSEGGQGVDGAVHRELAPHAALDVGARPRSRSPRREQLARSQASQAGRPRRRGRPSPGWRGRCAGPEQGGARVVTPTPRGRRRPRLPGPRGCRGRSAG